MTDATTTQQATQQPTTVRTKIMARIQPYTCGCRGSDPWHAAKFTRTIRDIRDIQAESIRTKFGCSYEMTRVGRAQFPWGMEWVGYYELYQARWQRWAILDEDAYLASQAEHNRRCESHTHCNPNATEAAGAKVVHTEMGSTRHGKCVGCGDSDIQPWDQECLDFVCGTCGTLQIETQVMRDDEDTCVYCGANLNDDDVCPRGCYDTKAS